MIWFGKSFIKSCKSFINFIKLVSTLTCSSARVRCYSGFRLIILRCFQPRWMALLPATSMVLHPVACWQELRWDSAPAYISSQLWQMSSWAVNPAVPLQPSDVHSTTILVQAAGSSNDLTFILFSLMHPRVFYAIELGRRIQDSWHMQGC